MPVTKYRSVAEMPPQPSLPPLAEDNLRCAFDLMDLAERLHPITRKPGLLKFGSIDEANAHRLEMERQQVSQHQSHRDDRRDG